MRRWRRVGRAAAAVAAASFGYIAYIYLTLPDVRALRTANLPSTAFMDLRAREARADGRTPVRDHRWVPYSRISPHLKRAVLVAEDAGFWGHEGIDLVEIRKSLEADWESGSLTRGASTITQQLAKNLYLSPSRNPLRKLTELFITTTPRARAEQDAHLRALSQRHRVGRRHLGRRSGGAEVLRHLGRGNRSRPGRADGRRHRQSARPQCRQTQRQASRTPADHPRPHGLRHAATCRRAWWRFGGPAWRSARRRRWKSQRRARTRYAEWRIRERTGSRIGDAARRSPAGTT